MNITNKEIGVIVAIVVVIGVFIYFAPASTDETEITDTQTEETNTEAKSPSSSTNSTPQASETGSPVAVPSGFALGQTIQLLGVTLTTTSVIEDSRCPTGSGSHACVWEGQVRVATRLRKDTYTSANTDDFEEFTLGVPKTYGDRVITLTSALPYPTIEKATRDSDYRFMWIVVPR